MMGFNRYDHLYLSYNKLRAIVDPNEPRLTGCEVEGNFKASAEGTLSMAGPSAKSNLESSKRIKYTALPGVDPAQRTQLLDVAAKTLEPLTRRAGRANSSTPYQAGSNYLYSGPCRFRLVTHDDWREDPENAPAPPYAVGRAIRWCSPTHTPHGRGDRRWQAGDTGVPADPGCG